MLDTLVPSNTLGVDASMPPTALGSVVSSTALDFGALATVCDAMYLVLSTAIGTVAGALTEPCTVVPSGTLLADTLWDELDLRP
jgi:hypothetical protein